MTLPALARSMARLNRVTAPASVPVACAAVVTGAIGRPEFAWLSFTLAACVLFAAATGGAIELAQARARRD